MLQWFGIWLQILRANYLFKTDVKLRQVIIIFYCSRYVLFKMLQILYSFLAKPSFFKFVNGSLFLIDFVYFLNKLKEFAFFLIFLFLSKILFFPDIFFSYNLFLMRLFLLNILIIQTWKSPLLSKHCLRSDWKWILLWYFKWIFGWLWMHIDSL